LNIGIYGGTFNPIHFGHLRTAEEVWAKFKLNKVVFMPCAQPPHKVDEEVIDSLHRLKMVTLAITGNEHFTASDLEVLRTGKSYTIETLVELRKQMPESDFYFILGLDAFLEINTWHRWEELFSQTNFIVTTRPGSKKTTISKMMPKEVRKQFKWQSKEQMFVHKSGKKVIFNPVTDINLSASRVRAMVREGMSIRYLLPRRVIEYITEHKLYR
jgi:nicotinate-nucleotide adenylyltransferase